MDSVDDTERASSDLARLVVASVGRLVPVDDEYEPYRLLDRAGTVVVPVAVFFRELIAAGRSPSTLRSYGMDCCGGGGSCIPWACAGTVRRG